MSAEASPIKRCPFCGGEGLPTITTSNPRVLRHTIICVGFGKFAPGCGASGRVTESVESATAAWNQRQGNPPPELDNKAARRCRTMDMITIILVSAGCTWVWTEDWRLAWSAITVAFLIAQGRLVFR